MHPNVPIIFPSLLNCHEIKCFDEMRGEKSVKAEIALHLYLHQLKTEDNKLQRSTPNFEE